jgi:XTP/dITP diphosphohydrolase
MVKAYRIQEKAKQVGFEWENKDQVFEKVKEELSELETEVNAENQNHQKVEEEFGDLLFSLINYARFLNIDPEMALEKTNKKFKKRFQYIEEHASKDLNDMTLEEMDLLWNEAKSH